MVSLLWHPGVHKAGASGAIFGVFGDLRVFLINKRNAVPRSNLHLGSTAGFISFHLVNGCARAGIDNGAHTSGVIGGMILGAMLARLLHAAARQSSFTPRRSASCLAGVRVRKPFLPAFSPKYRSDPGATI